jgi:Ni,Fe-hydrogenase maturation factor
VIGIKNRGPGAENQDLNSSIGPLVTLSSYHPATVVIGYGNDLRGDDAIGPLAARAVAAWDASGVCGLAVHQLTPELAEILATAELAIFVDALVSAPATASSASFSILPACGEGEPGDVGEAAVEVLPLAPGATDSAIGHTADPRALLALAAALYGRCPPAWSISVPAQSFAFGAPLSPVAARGLATALQQVSNLIASTYAANR